MRLKIMKRDSYTIYAGSGPMELKLPPNRSHVQRYKGRLIKADPADPRRWYVYCVGAEGCPVLYIGISTNPKRRFKKHMERFKEAPQPLSLWVYRKSLQHVEARRKEIDLHTRYPHARTVATALEHLLVLSNSNYKEPPADIPTPFRHSGGSRNPASSTLPPQWEKIEMVENWPKQGVLSNTINGSSMGEPLN